MAVVFLIGGTGNQLFQYATAGPNDVFSTWFISPLFRRFMNWTPHEQLVAYPPVKSYLAAIALLVLALDLVATGLFTVSFFSSLDTRKTKAKPILFEFVRLGYFQHERQIRTLEPVAKQIGSRAKKGLIVIHVRGGDILELERLGMNNYGLLTTKYYLDALSRGIEYLQSKDRSEISVQVLTDDAEYAKSFDFPMDHCVDFSIKQCSLREMMSEAIGAEYFVSSNSSLAYWVIRLRDDLNCVAPRPFQKFKDYEFADGVVRLGVNY